RAQQFGKLESAWSGIAPHDRVTALHRLCLSIDREQRDELVEALGARAGAGVPRIEEEPV
ncbi:MAG: hypothetical protein OXE57_10275, partial [Alphaproteobacteria bacterium]|nr:hypothetical protein [Alphaproteobacteria bacterium]